MRRRTIRNEKPTDVFDQVPWLVHTCIPVAALFAYGSLLQIVGSDPGCASPWHMLTILSCIEFMFVLPLEGLWNLFTATNKVKQTSIYMFANSIVTIIIVLVALRFTTDDTMKLYIIAGTSTAFAVIRSLFFLPIYGARCLDIKMDGLLSIHPEEHLVGSSWLRSSRCWSGTSDHRRLDDADICRYLTSIFAIGFNFIVLLNKEERSAVVKKVLRK